MRITNKFKKNYSGVSLVEVLVVMVIFMIITGLGYSSVVNFKLSTEIQSAALQFESVVKTVQNWARNNVISKVDPKSIEADPFSRQVDSYLLYFDYSDKIFKVYSCEYYDLLTIYDCDQEPFDSQLAGEVELVEGANPCSGIMYENLSGDIKILEPGVGTVSLSSISPGQLLGTTCEVKLQHARDTNKYYVEYSFDQPTSSFKKNEKI